jgi:hypothetical protein
LQAAIILASAKSTRLTINIKYQQMEEKQKSADLTQEAGQSTTTERRTYADVIQLIPSTEDSPIGELEVAEGGRGRSWKPNIDAMRTVEVFKPMNAPATLRLGRNSSNKGEGISCRSTEIEDQFDLRVRSIGHRSAATLILTNGLELKGYVNNSKSKCGLYFPLSAWPKDVPLPMPGYKLPVKVLSLVIG